MRTIPARPYPWPYHGAPQPARTALLIFSDPHDAAPPPSVAQRLLRLVTAARERRIVVIALPPLAGRACFPLASVAAEIVIPRPHFGAFAGTHLDSVLRRRGVTDLLIAGFPFELGADCTMREANDRGYECLAVEDCCSGLSEQTLAGAISSIQFSGGIFGAVAPAGDVIVALREGETDASPASRRPLPLAL